MNNRDDQNIAIQMKFVSNIKPAHGDERARAQIHRILRQSLRRCLAACFNAMNAFKVMTPN